MHFNIGAFSLNQFVLLFAAAFLGLAFGKIKIGKFSFGLSGTLFSGLLLGWASVAFARSIGEGDALYKTAQKVVTGGIVHYSSWAFNRKRYSKSFEKIWI
jgi:putative transport protein